MRLPFLHKRPVDGKIQYLHLTFDVSRTLCWKYSLCSVKPLPPAQGYVFKELKEAWHFPLLEMLSPDFVSHKKLESLFAALSRLGLAGYSPLFSEGLLHNVLKRLSGLNPTKMKETDMVSHESCGAVLPCMIVIEGTFSVSCEHVSLLFLRATCTFTG